MTLPLRMAATLMVAGSVSVSATCGERSVTRVVQGISADVDGVVYANPRAHLVALDASGQPVADATLLANGTPVPPATPDGGWAPGAYDIEVRAPEGCSAPAGPIKLVVDADRPGLTYRVAPLADFEGKAPDFGRKKRFLWWWIQPEKQRLVWSDGATSWDPVRQRAGIEVNATPGRNRIFVWAPDESPFEESGRENDLDAERLLIIEATDLTSGVGGLRLRLVETEPEKKRRGSARHFRLVAEATDRVGNATTLELPYIARETAGPRRGPF